MDFNDYYKELGLEKGASEADVKKAFRKLAREFHPDTNPNNPDAEERFKKISEAYEVLSDPQKKAKYDQVSSQYNAYRSRPGSAGSWQEFGRNGGASFDMDDMGQTFQGTSFGDLLSQLFGGRGQETGRRAQPRQAEKIFSITLTLDEAFTGVTKRLAMGDSKLDVTFKPGIADGQRLKVPGGYLEARIATDKRFTRDGADLRATEHIPFTVAVLGGAHEVRMIDGSVSVNIAAGTQSGKMLRLKGKGMPKYDDPKHHGDLYLTIFVDVPKQLTDDQRELITKLKESGL